MKQKLFSVTIHDCRVDTFRGSGKGGQNRNKRDTAVRVVHEPSGAIGTATEYRTQGLNKRAAFQRMAETKQFQKWNQIMAAKVMGIETLEDRVDRAMAPQNLLIETHTQEGWKTV